MKPVQWQAALTLMIGACSFSPLTNRIKVGEEDIVVFVGEGADGNTDLFVSNTAGGTPTQLTYTVAVETLPRLTADGGMLAFVRARDAAGDGARLVVMNMLSATERSIELPASAGTPTALGWSPSGDALYVATSSAMWRTPAPPAALEISPVNSGDPTADSSLTAWLGEPRFARAIPCGQSVCVIGPSGDTTEIARGGSGGMRWGSDSVAWFEDNVLVVRGLGPGPARRVTWRKAPANARDATYAKGAGLRRDGP